MRLSPHLFFAAFGHFGLFPRLSLIYRSLIMVYPGAIYFIAPSYSIKIGHHRQFPEFLTTFWILANSYFCCILLVSTILPFTITASLLLSTYDITYMKCIFSNSVVLWSYTCSVFVSDLDLPPSYTILTPLLWASSFIVMLDGLILNHYQPSYGHLSLFLSCFTSLPH